MLINIDAIMEGRLNKFKPFYDRFLELDLSENNTTNANEAIGLAWKFMAADYFYMDCTKDVRKDVYMKLSKAFEIIGDRANADKYANKINEIDEMNEIDRMKLLFQSFYHFPLGKSNLEKAIKLASDFVEEPYFLNSSEINRNCTYTKLAKVYCLKGEYENAYKYLCKNTGIVCIKDEDQNRIEILNSACNYHQEKELMEICYDVYHKLGYLSKAEYEQCINPGKETYFQKVLKETDPDIMTKEEFELLFDRFETLDLSKNNKKDAKEAIELASKFMDIPIFNEQYNELPMSNIYGKLGEAYYIVGKYCSAIINLAKTGRLEEDGKLKELYDKSCNELPKIYMAIEEIDACTKDIGKPLVEDPLNFDMQ